jgi:hypothetical protein
MGQAELKGVTQAGPRSPVPGAASLSLNKPAPERFVAIRLHETNTPASLSTRARTAETGPCCQEVLMTQLQMMQPVEHTRASRVNRDGHLRIGG